jgi:TPR repeat protein
MLDDGNGIAENNALAVYWYRQAAEQGNHDAQNNLGAMYDAGEGVSQDKAAALYWYRLSAEQGNAVAQNNLGALYFSGEGSAQDKREAYKWFYIAERLGNESGKQNRERSAQALALEDLLDARREAQSWLSEHLGVEARKD